MRLASSSTKLYLTGILLPIIIVTITTNYLIISAQLRSSNLTDDQGVANINAPALIRNVRMSSNEDVNYDYLESEEMESQTAYAENDTSIQHNNTNTSVDCFKARTDTVHPSLYHNLPKPYINLGFPKTGTTSLYSFFKCGGIKSSHYYCRYINRTDTSKFRCATCMTKAVAKGLSPISECRGQEQEVYAQIDDGQYFPQIELLEEIVNDDNHPNATFFLTFRSMDKWYKSLSNWPPRSLDGIGLNLVDRLVKSNITGSPTKSDPKHFSHWYCKHIQRVRDVIDRHPSHSLVEVDIEDPMVGQRMSDMFGIRKSCWGQKNVNAKIHPEMNG